VRTPRLLCWSLALALAGLSGIAAPALAQKSVPKGTKAVKVLLLTGGQRNHHGYRDQALYLSSALEDTGRYEVTLAEDASILESPALRKYNILIVNADRRDDEHKFTEAQQRALLDYVKQGHGYVSIHGADNAPADWIDDWRDMLGGIYSHTGLPDGKTKLGTFTVKIVDTHSPVTKGLKDFELKDELYYNMQMRPNVQPLATIDFNNTAWPVAWTRTYGSGKVFHTPLGHRRYEPGSHEPLHNPYLLKLVIQGVNWVAGIDSEYAPREDTPAKSASGR
jgi:type 1 glutamine amidotransferase